MPGNSPREAVGRFLEPIKDAIQCLGDGILIYKSNPGLGTLEAATLNGGEGMALRSPLYGRLRVEINFQYVVVESDDDRGPYRCSTRAYIFSISDRRDVELISFHWHPLARSPDLGPHMHVGTTLLPQAASLHVPTMRVTVEEIVEHLIDSFAVEPTVEESLWRPLLAASKAKHIEHGYRGLLTSR